MTVVIAGNDDRLVAKLGMQSAGDVLPIARIGHAATVANSSDCGRLLALAQPSAMSNAGALTCASMPLMT